MQLRMMQIIGHKAGLFKFEVLTRNKRKFVVAKLAEFFLGELQPLHKAVLMNVFDGTHTVAGVEERLIWCGLRPAYSADVCGRKERTV